MTCQSLSALSVIVLRWIEIIYHECILDDDDYRHNWTCLRSSMAFINLDWHINGNEASLNDTPPCKFEEDDVNHNYRESSTCRDQISSFRHFTSRLSFAASSIGLSPQLTCWISMVKTKPNKMCESEKPLRHKFSTSFSLPLRLRISQKCNLQFSSRNHFLCTRIPAKASW